MPAELAGQTVVVIGGSGGIGLETGRLARASGAAVILAARSQDRLGQAAAEIGAEAAAAFDATDPDALDRFFAGLPGQIDHVMVTGPGPYYALLADAERERARQDFDAHVWLPVSVAQHAVGRVRPGGTLLFMGGTGGRRPAPGQSLIGAITAAQPALVANLAVEIARSGSTSSPLASLTRRCRPPCWAATWTSAVRSCAPAFPSGASSGRLTSPPSPCTSWPTPR